MSASSADQNWQPRYNPWLIAWVVTIATFMEVLDTSIANVALPHIAGSLAAGVDESTWVLTSYLVANAIILPLNGLFSSILGRKRYYMVSVAMFTLSSLLCGLAPNLHWLVFFRVLQGLGGGGLQPTSQAILLDTFPAEQIGMAMALYGVSVVTAPIIGPTLGGWITDNYNWRWIFFINIPIGLLSLLPTARVVEDPPYLERRPASILTKDSIALGVIAVGLGSFQVMLDKGQRLDWFESRAIVILAALAGAGLVFTLIWEAFQKEPVVEVHLLEERNFFISNILIFMVGFVLYGSTVLLPLLLQTLIGYSATKAGLVLSPGGIMTMICMPLVGLLLGRVQARWLIAFGLAVMALSLEAMARFSLQVDYGTAVTARLIQSAALAFLFVPINAAAYAFVPGPKHTQASGMINLSRNIGGGVGIALASTILARYSQVHQSILSANLNAMNPQYQAALHRTAQRLIWRGVSPANAPALAHGILYQELVRQSTMLAYITDFRFMSMACLGTLLLVFLLKRGDITRAPMGE
ncbi:MAG TPA: DHA2 family efflux MFS transporter permease subunit [Elusimicrobiota bacterium]|nr:DHA2 family efflux MFS transporter permease subunit [Elusimicrobiota bacterium]